MRIMVTADVHMRTEVDKSRQERSFKALKKAFGEVPCDLAVFLGDLMHGPDYRDDKQRYIKDLHRALDVTGDVPFAFVFGNHDDECAMTKDEILSIIGEYKNSLTDGRNYVLRKNNETLLFIDSGSYYEGRGSHYDTVKPEVSYWAKEQVKDGDKAILFQHIIIPDIMGVLKRCGIKKYRFKDGFDYTGELNERPCPPKINTGELSILAPHLKAMVFGHDHINNFECELEGVKLIQCGCTSLNGYEGPEWQPTVRVIDTETLKTEIVKV